MASKTNNTPNGQHNIVRPHETLKIYNPQQIQGKVWRKYEKQTPAMSANNRPCLDLKRIINLPIPQKHRPIKGTAPTFAINKYNHKRFLKNL